MRKRKQRASLDLNNYWCELLLCTSVFSFKNTRFMFTFSSRHFLSVYTILVLEKTWKSNSFGGVNGNLSYRHEQIKDCVYSSTQEANPCSCLEWKYSYTKPLINKTGYTATLKGENLTWFDLFPPFGDVNKPDFVVGPFQLIPWSVNP